MCILVQVKLYCKCYMCTSLTPKTIRQGAIGCLYQLCNNWESYRRFTKNTSKGTCKKSKVMKAYFTKKLKITKKLKENIFVYIMVSTFY